MTPDRLAIVLHYALSRAGCIVPGPRGGIPTEPRVTVLEQELQRWIDRGEVRVIATGDEVAYQTRRKTATPASVAALYCVCQQYGCLLTGGTPAVAPGDRCGHRTQGSDWVECGGILRRATPADLGFRKGEGDAGTAAG